MIKFKRGMLTCINKIGNKVSILYIIQGSVFRIIHKHFGSVILRGAIENYKA